MVKPFSIQSPENIAKEYGGNKQKIAEAMQMGIIDPTAGVLAGMFIDRMRSAQIQEAAPQSTVAQQVMGGAPVASAAPPASPQSPGGLGATAQAAPPMTPQMAAPEESPMGMKSGGSVHGHAEYHHGDDKYASYGADIPLDDRTRFNLEAGGRNVFDPDYLAAAIHHRVGDADLSASHALRGGGGDYGVETPFLGGHLGVHAGASQGFLPDSIRASYTRRFAEGGMVPPYAMGGGLSEVPVPDTMFDEPGNGGFDDGYAGGGLVAFAPGGSTGGMTGLYGRVEQAESGGRQGAVSPKGARGVMQLMPGTMRDPGFGVPSVASLIQAGMSEEEANRHAGRKYLDAMYRRYGDQDTALMAYNWGPGNVDKWIAAGRPAGMVPSETRNYLSKVAGSGPTPAAGGLGATAQSGQWGGPSLESQVPGAYKYAEEFFSKNIPAPKNEGLGILTEEARKVLSPEEQKKRASEDKWMALAEIGFNMAASNSPYLLQAVGAAAAAALPGARAAKKEREADKRQAINDLANAENITYQQALDKANYIRGVAKDKLDITDKDIGRKFTQAQVQYQETAQTGRATIAEQGATARANAQAAAATGAEFRQNQKILRDQAEAARDRAMSLHRDFIQAADDETKAALADQIEAEVHNMATYNEQLKSMGGGSINWQPEAFRNYRDWAKTTNYVSPYAQPKPQPQAGAQSSAMQAADRILAGQ